MKRKVFAGALVACLMMVQGVAAEELQVAMADEVQAPEVSRAIVPTTLSSGVSRVMVIEHLDPGQGQRN